MLSRLAIRQASKPTMSSFLPPEKGDASMALRISVSMRESPS